MKVVKPVGRDAAVRKYDMLSAMMAYAMAGDQHRQRLVLRFMSLITTRYNWQRNELTMGQREIARLWCVDERTVKRDMARLRALGWLLVQRQGARGRVSVLSLDLERIMLDTRAEWGNIGEDFIGRQAPDEAIGQGTVIPFRRAEPVAGQGLWAAACRQLAAEDPPTFDAWLAGLRDAGLDQGVITLLAPTKFHATYVRTHFLSRIALILRRLDGDVTRVQIVARDPA